jgi:hypothetical protein
VPGVGGSVLIRRILGSLARDVRARPLLRLLELGAMASSSALARAAVCLNASRVLAGRDRGDERQNHNDDPGHRCGLRARSEFLALAGEYDALEAVCRAERKAALAALT